MTFLAPSPSDQRVMASPPNDDDLLTACQQVVAGTIAAESATRAIAPSTEEDASTDNSVA